MFVHDVSVGLSIGTIFNFFYFDVVKEKRSCVKLVVREDEHSDQQDKELHWHFEQAIHQKAHRRIANRGARQVAAYLTLIGTEIGKLQEETPDQSGPDGVLVVQVETPVYGIGLPRFPCDMQRFYKANIVG